MKSFWKILFLLIGTLLVGMMLRPSERGVSAEPIQRAPEGGTPVQAGSSPAVREIEAAEVLPFVNKEINPRQNPSLLDPDMGRDGTWERTDVPIDPLIDLNTRANRSTTPDPNIVFDGSTGCNGCSPPDVTGAVGPNHYVSMTNVHFTIFNKDGSIAKDKVAFNSLFAGSNIDHPVCSVQNDGDPIPIYDQMAERWLLTQFAGSPGAPVGYICAAVSKTSDPLGEYWLYEFQVGAFPDYFKFGAWPDGYYMSANEATYTAYVFDRNNMIDGNPATFQKFTGGTNLYLPSDMDGDSPPPAGAPNYFYTFKDASYNDHGVNTDRVEIWEFKTDWETPNNSTFTLADVIDVTPFTYTACGFFNFNCTHQRDTTQRVDSLGEWPLFRFPYRNFGDHEALVGTFGVGGGTGQAGASLRWFELRKTNDAWSLYQEGTQDLNDGHDRTNGSITMDRCGNIALGYSVMSDAIFPAIRYTTRLATDPLGTMGTEVEMLAGGGSQTNSPRWGDYSTLAIDPTDDMTFWFTNEYYKTSSGSGWATSVGSWTLDDCTNSVDDFTITPTPADQTICLGQDALYSIEVAALGGFNSPVTLSTSGNPGSATFSNATISTFPNSSDLTLSGVGAGDYAFEIIGTSAVTTNMTTASLHVLNGAPNAPTSVAPADGGLDVGTMPTFMWSLVNGATSYNIEIATDATFATIVESAANLTTTSYTPTTTLDNGTVYYWRVTANSDCGNTVSETFAFETSSSLAAICEQPNGAIPDTFGLTSYTDSITINETGALTDLDIFVDVSHEFIGDLTFEMEHVDSGTSVTFITPPDGGSCAEADIVATLDDEAATSVDTQCDSIPPAIDGTFQPSNPLTAFDGEDVSGEWELTVTDNEFVIAGTVNEWCLIPSAGGQVSADLSDSPSSYGLARHTGDGALRLGDEWTEDSSFAADGDDATDDGVSITQPVPTRNAGAQLQVSVDVTGTTTGANGWLKGWFDWNQNGLFDADELAVNTMITVDGGSFDVDAPDEVDGEIQYRFRLFDSETEPAIGATGSADGGEVEDGSATIVDTAIFPVTLSMRDDAVSVNEDAGTVDVLVEISDAHNRFEPLDIGYTAMVSGSASAADFTAISETITVGQQGSSVDNTVTLTIPIQDDLLDEIDETFSVMLISAGPNATIFGDTTIVTIVNDDPEPAISLTDSVVVDEGMGTATVTVTIPADRTSFDVTVDYTTAESARAGATPGSDYTPISGTITIPVGETTATVSVEIENDDENNEGDETFNINFSNATRATLDPSNSSTTVTISDDEIPTAIGLNRMRGLTSTVWWLPLFALLTILLTFVAVRQRES